MLLRFVCTGKPADASLFVARGEPEINQSPPDRSPSRPPSKGGDQMLLRFLFHGEASGCFAFCCRGDLGGSKL